MSDNFYRAFEDRYRGSRELITARLTAYQPFYAALAALYPGGKVLDLGCGRGEWLELLDQQGFDTFGVDLDDGMLAACRERGLHVELTDALSALRATPEASVAMVSAFHLVEHIPFDAVQDLIREARRVLLPGGLLVMETPNPENLVVGASSFYMDPSHLRPIPPLLLDFVVGFAGFARQKILRLQEAEELRGARPIALIDVLDGVSPDYAVIGQKEAADEILAPFGAPFAATYGLALADLAVRYQEQDNHRNGELHLALARMDHRIGLGEQSGIENFDALHKGLARIAEGVEHNRRRHDETAPLLLQLQEALENQAGQAQQAEQHRIAAREQFELLAHRVGAAEERAAQHQRRVEELLASSSWRVTAPLRMVSGYAWRMRSAVRDGRIKTGVKRRIIPPLLSLMRALLRRPRAKRAALSVLRRFPGLHARLYGVLRRGHGAPPAPPPPSPFPPSASAEDLSPRAQQIYQELKQAIDSRKN